MATIVNVTMYKAADESLHDSEEQANRHDRTKRLDKSREKVADHVETILDYGNTPFNSLRDSLFSGRWETFEQYAYERQEFKEELVSMLIDNWDSLKPLVESYIAVRSK